MELAIIFIVLAVLAVFIAIGVKGSKQNKNKPG
jgi:hypothetical protein